MNLKERFLTYVAFDTQSDPHSETFPSTAKQLKLLNYLAEEMKQLGLSEVSVDEYGYAMGTIPATEGEASQPVIGLISHVDTSPDMNGTQIHPQIIEQYDGTDIRLNDNLWMKTEEFAELKDFVGHTLITTDGTTLLGADDKAGIAEIMTAAEYLMTHPEIPRGKIRLGFTPDEEIGRGVDYFDVKRFGADFAYTVDGGYIGELEYENFNAAGAKITIQGRNIHPGYAKNKMLNALEIGCEFHNLLPACEKPQHTQGYEGFYHLTALSGEVEKASMEYIVRDHSREKFEAKKRFMESAAAFINNKYGAGTLTLTLKDQYYNMREMVEPHPEIIERAKRAMLRAGVEPIVRPIRGGTDGSRLSYMGLPCPNIFTGGMNFHGKFEYCSLDVMQKTVETILNIVRTDQ